MDQSLTGPVIALKLAGAQTRWPEGDSDGRVCRYVAETTLSHLRFAHLNGMPQRIAWRHSCLDLNAARLPGS